MAQTMVRHAETASRQLTEPEVFRQFYTEALPRVYGYFRYRADADAVEDLTQETFMAAVRELKSGVAVAAPMPWLLGIARHKLLDHYRRQRRIGWTIITLDPELLESIEGEGSLDALDDGTAATALASVPSPQREALALRYLDGLSVPEISEALGRSVSATESLLARARASFKRIYLETLNSLESGHGH